jgi:hypothetical protein
MIPSALLILQNEIEETGQMSALLENKVARGVRPDSHLKGTSNNNGFDA